jgi:outer membrane murein-binding lipoprotein Lpp
MTDRNLEEAIFELQRLNTENGVKRLAEEAAQLFAEGRQIEASAVMEKAEAMLAVRSGPASSHGPSSHVIRPRQEERTKVDEQTMAKMAAKLADGLSSILTGAFDELERHILGESRKISTSFEQQLDRLQATVGTLEQLQAKFKDLSDAVSEVRSTASASSQKQDQFSTSVAGLEATSARHDKEIGALRGETTALRTEAKDYATVVAHQMDALSARIGLHQEDLTGLKSTLAEISRKMAGFGERVDRQSDVIRSITDSQAKRAIAFDELLAVLTRLKEPAETAIAAGAGQF